MPDILRFDDSRATRFASRLKRDATGNLLLSGTVHDFFLLPIEFSIIPCHFKMVNFTGQLLPEKESAVLGLSLFLG